MHYKCGARAGWKPASQVAEQFLTRGLFILVFASVALGQPAAQPSSSPTAPAPASSPTAQPATPTKSAEQIAADERFAKRLEEIDAAMGKVADLRAEFEQRKHTPLLKKPLVSKGTVATKGDKVRWDTASPRASSMLIGDGEIRMYYPADKLLEVYPVGDGFKDLASSPLPRLSSLKNQFDLAPLALKEIGANERDANLVAVRMTPKHDELKKHVVLVKVLIDASKPAALKVVTKDPEGEETEILFSGVRLNSGVKDEEMTLKLPDGVRVSRPLGGGEKGDKKDEGVKKNEPEKKP